MKTILKKYGLSLFLVIIIIGLIIDKSVSFKNKNEYRFLTEEDYFNSVNTTLEASNKFMNAITIFSRDTLTVEQDIVIKKYILKFHRI